MGVLQYRLDGRMLHGQVRHFASQLNIDYFVVVNEATANDDTQVMLLELAALNAEVEVLSPEEAFDVLDSGELDDYRVMVVFKEIYDAEELVKLGYDEMGKLVISGMFQNKEATKEHCGPSLFVDARDKAALKYLLDKGVELTHQISPEYAEKQVKDLVKL